jgi:hypothetical protein
MIDEREVREMLLRRAHTVPATPVGNPAVARRALRRLVLNGAVATVAVAAIAVATVAGVDALRTAPIPGPIPGHESTPTPKPDIDEIVRGWPGRTRNPAGVYSWDASPVGEFPAATMGFMHNAYSPGSGHVNMVFDGDPGRIIPHRGQTAVTVAGYEGTYRRFIGDKSPWRNWAEGGPVEEWMVDIQGTTVTFLLIAEPGAPKGEVAEAREIIRSIRVEPQNTQLGFRLIFTLATNTWDSG